MYTHALHCRGQRKPWLNEVLSECALLTWAQPCQWLEYISSLGTAKPSWVRFRGMAKPSPGVWVWAECERVTGVYKHQQVQIPPPGFPPWDCIYRNLLLRHASPSPCVVPDTHTEVPGFIGSRPLNQHMHAPALDPSFYAHVSMCLSFLHFRATPRQGSRPKPLSTWHSGSSDMYISQLLTGQLILQLYDGLKAILIQEKPYLDFLSFPVLEICNIITCTILNVEFFYVLFCFDYEV